MSPVSSTHGWIDTQMLQVNITMGDFPVVNWRQRSLQLTKIPKIPPKPFIICMRNTHSPLWPKGNATPIDDAIKGAPKWKHKPMMRPRIKGKDLRRLKVFPSDRTRRTPRNSLSRKKKKVCKSSWISGDTYFWDVAQIRCSKIPGFSHQNDRHFCWSSCVNTIPILCKSLPMAIQGSKIKNFSQKLMNHQHNLNLLRFAAACRDEWRTFESSSLNSEIHAMEGSKVSLLLQVECVNPANGDLTKTRLS